MARYFSWRLIFYVALLLFHLNGSMAAATAAGGWRLAATAATAAGDG